MPLRPIDRRAMGDLHATSPGFCAGCKRDFETEHALRIHHGMRRGALCKKFIDGSVTFPAPAPNEELRAPDEDALERESELCG